MNRKVSYLILLIAFIVSNSNAAQWNPQTTNWTNNPNPAIGDWGFNRPGYPAGLYIHGITIPASQTVINPVIYDNDVFDDVFDDEWTMAMASLGKMNLKGLIVTPVLTDFWPPFYRPDWINTATDAYKRAKESGMCMERIPEITIGTEAGSEAEGINKRSAGSDLYVKLINLQYSIDPSKPLIINIGGQSATLASAFVQDNSIADKCIVYYTDISVYNGHYEWASQLIAKNFRVIDFYNWINKPCQNKWNVLPRPNGCGTPNANDRNSGEWAQIPDNVICNNLVYGCQSRGEYDQRNSSASFDAYGDGAFIHAWLPEMYTSGNLISARNGQVLSILTFNETLEALVKAATFPVIINPDAYDGVCQDTK